MLLKTLVATACAGRAAATAGSGTHTGRGRPIRGFSRAEHGELQRMPLARALRAFDFLTLGHHNALVTRLAIIANIFVNRHF